MVLKTKILKNTAKNISLTADLLKRKKIVGIPTETVYGLGALASDSKSINRIYKIKKLSLGY